MAENKSDDTLWLIIFLFALFGGGGWLIWSNFKIPLTDTLMTVRAAQMDLASLWMKDDDIITVKMPREVNNDEGMRNVSVREEEVVQELPAKFGVWHKFAATVQPEQVTNDHIKVVTYVALSSIKYLLTAVLLYFFFWAVFKGPTSYFRRGLGYDGLIAEQSKTFKIIAPFIKFNPNKTQNRAPGSPVPAVLPLFAEALSPEEWVALNEVPVKDGQVHRAAAERAFTKQLGARWQGPFKLAPELQILLAAFCLKAARKRDESDDMLGRLAMCWDFEKGLRLRKDWKLLGQARKILRDTKLSGSTLSKCNRHAYVTTAMIRALNTARSEGGVLAPAQFVWLRGHNRALWYPLNNLGRQAFHLEALGAMSHYRAEKQIDRPIIRPRMTDAVDGLIEFFKNPLFVKPIPSVDTSMVKRRDRNKNTNTMQPRKAS